MTFFEWRPRFIRWARAARTHRIAAAAMVAVSLAGLLVGLDAFVLEPQLRLAVTEIHLPAGHGGRLARSLKGVRVVHLSDLHVRGMGWRERRLIRRLGELEPDLVLITGDYGEGREGMQALVEVLRSVHPALGTFGVPGNNDYYRGWSERIKEALAAAGVTLLVNGSTIVRAPGGDVAIAGVDDPFYGRDDVARAMEEVPEGLPVILLAHAPELLARDRSRALMMNAGDARGPWGRGWFWQDGAHVRWGPAEVTFPSTGARRLRVQRREDGVGIDEVRLVPVAAGAPRNVEPLGRKETPAPATVSGQIVIRAADVRDEDVHGGWLRQEIDDGVALVDAPDRGVNQTYAEVAPASYFEAGFEAVGGIRYHVWVHLRSGNGRGTSDSLYVQFTDSLDVDGRPDYRIGEVAAGVDAARVDLMLAGHTHGGQVRLPFIGPVEPNVRRGPYQAGLYRMDGMALYVSRGIGWSALPVRFMCPPEVVVLEGQEESQSAGSF